MKKLVVSIIILSMLLLNINIVNAATGSASLNSSSTSVKPGDTFTVTLSAKCEEGINGIDTTYSYDEDKLELKSANVANDKWANLGETGTIQVISNSTSKITSDDIFVLTFKVKDNIAVGTTAKVSTSEIKIDSDASENSIFTEVAKSLNINIASTSSDASGNNGGSQGSSTVNSNNNSGTTNNSKESSNGVNKNNKNSSDKSTSGTALPKTGDTSIILVSLIILVSISSIVFYIKMKKQK